MLSTGLHFASEIHQLPFRLERRRGPANVNSKSEWVPCRAPRPQYSRRRRPDLWGRRSRTREREINDVESGEIE